MTMAAVHTNRRGRLLRLPLFALLSQHRPRGVLSAFLPQPHVPPPRRKDGAAAASLRAVPSPPSWTEIESTLQPSYSAPQPLSIDSVLDPSTPKFSDIRPTLFRERHGWCPYSERVWLALEVKGVPYDTVRIDNTGGGRPPYYAGQTPQMRWPEGRTQGESMDLVREVDERYPEYGPALYPKGREDEVEEKIRAFSNTFPRKSRPSSRAAFLFDWSGEPLWRSEFERVLSDADALLAESSGGGPFLCGADLTAADVAWAPFLERYAAQLPCLHDGLNPRDADAHPNLSRWYDAMDGVPAYACRVGGDRSSWRKVLSMAGFGNAGVPPKILDRMDGEAEVEGARPSDDEAERERELWGEYAATRPHVAGTAAAETAAVVTRNRAAIAADVLKRLPLSEEWVERGLPSDEEGLNTALRGLVAALLEKECEAMPGVGPLASYLDERMCVPRDMGSMSAAAIKRLAKELS